MLKTGDVVIKRKRSMPSICAFGVVIADGGMPDLEALGVDDARERARKWVAETSGTIHELDQDTGEPFA